MTNNTNKPTHRISIAVDDQFYNLAALWPTKESSKAMLSGGLHANNVNLAMVTAILQGKASLVISEITKDQPEANPSE